MKIIHIEEAPNKGINISLDNGKFASFFPFGETIYSSMSDGLQKKDFHDFKRDITRYNWNIEKLREIWSH